MKSKYEKIFQEKMSEQSFQRFAAIENEKVFNFIGFFAEHCNPKSIYVCDDSKEDELYIRQMALEKGEEAKLAKEGQTVHWDGYGDQARDKENTKYLVYKENLQRMAALNSIEYEEGYNEIIDISRNIMEGKDVVVKFFCEGPAFSKFTIPCVQFTDSWYVAHSESILYRPAYEHFKNMEEGEKDDFFRFIHSAGELDERNCSVNLDKRRVYMDTQNNIVYSMNNQYGGNSIGLKKHAMRLAINKAGQEDWLCEHMFLMACVNHKTDRKTYFAGAYPSACGKTSTAMIPGELVVGDDITYFRNLHGEFRGVNVEQGIFGIIKDVNAEDDPLIFENLMKEQELIFSNVLRGPDNNPYWQNCGMDEPDSGDNHSGLAWYRGKKDAKGNEIPIAHSNARYTMRLDYLANFDKEGFDARDGVKIEGILYGGRDSDTTVPIEESDFWEEGILLKACTLESETTSATLGQEGVRKPSPMANLDFVAYPLGEYTINNIRFVEGMKEAPAIFSTNYFLLTPDNKFCNPKTAKKVWLHWAEARVHGDYDALETPTGKIPKYEDLQKLFKELLDIDYTKEEYVYQFTFRGEKWLGKLQRTKEFFKKMDPNCPDYLFKKWDEYIEKVQKAMQKYGENIEPGVYQEE